METSQPEPNFTVSKIGRIWLEGIGFCEPHALPPLLHIRWAEVNDLQFEFCDCTIWLTFETIHVINRGVHRSAHWAETDIIRSYCQ